MRYVALIAACVLLVCTAAVRLGDAFEMTDDVAAYVDLAKEIAGVVLAVAVLYLWFPRFGRSPTQA